MATALTNYRSAPLIVGPDGREPEGKNGNYDRDDWKSLFHTHDDFVNAPSLSFAIGGGLIQEKGINFFLGLPAHGKTLLMLNVVKALLQGGNLFDHKSFPVIQKANRVLYLIPEVSIEAFKHRLELFGLMPHVESGKLMVRTLSAREPGLKLSDHRIAKAVEGADVFLDTAVRFIDGNENDASDVRKFAQTLFNLQAHGARLIVGAHHAPKTFAKVKSIDGMTLENATRGSGDIGAMLSVGWVMRQTDSKANRVTVKNVKGRDSDEGEWFELEGRPHINQQGSFKLIQSTVGNVKIDVPENTVIERAQGMRKRGDNNKQIAQALGVDVRTVQRWQSDGKLDVQVA